MISQRNAFLQVPALKKGVKLLNTHFLQLLMGYGEGSLLQVIKEPLSAAGFLQRRSQQNRLSAGNLQYDLLMAVKSFMLDLSGCKCF